MHDPDSDGRDRPRAPAELLSVARAGRPAEQPRLPEYPARAYGPAHPARLATIARLHGLDPVPPFEARVLELGCGAGVNLLSIASSLPGSHCVGVDADPEAIARARQLAGDAGLSAIEFICADLRAVADRVDEADYILAHGVWSWVPDDVQAAIAELCAGRLAPDGVALISYNALPGWYTWLPARWLGRQAMARDPEADPAVAARRAVDLARSLHGPDDGPYGAVLAAAVERYAQLEPGHLLRDDLADGSRPFWLEEVAKWLVATGLQYLGEAIPDQWWHWRAAQLTADRVRGAADASLLARQQFVDLAAGVDFKATLFTRSHPSLEPDPAAIVDFYASARPDAVPPASSASPAMRELAGALMDARPGALTISELAQRCQRSEESAARAVLRLVAERLADVDPGPPAWANEAPDRPEVHPLARAQAGASAEVTSLRHDQVVLQDPNARTLMTLMDGTRDRAALADELERLTGASGASARSAVQDFLPQLANLGLLSGGVS
jgi:SAM-dependent methyltransferase